MSRFNTGNPLDSDNLKDLSDNAKNIDLAANSSADTFQDRLGKSRLTWAGIVKAGTGDAGVIVPVVQQAVQDVIDGVDGQVAVAQSAANRAEAASDAAFVNADVYPDVATGRAAVADGEQFQVLSADGLEYIRYRRNSSSSQTEVGRLKTSSGVDQGLSGAKELSYSLTHDLASQFGDSILTRKGVPLSGEQTTYDSSDIIPVYQGQVIRMRLQIYGVYLVAHSFKYHNRGGYLPAAVGVSDMVPERVKALNGPEDLYYIVPPHVTGMRFWSMNSTDSRYIPDWFRVEIWNPKSMYDPVNWNLDTFLSRAMVGTHTAGTSTYSTLITAVKAKDYVVYQGLGGNTRKTAFLDSNYDLLTESSDTSGAVFAPEGAAYLQIVTTNRDHSSYVPEMEEEFFIKTGTPYEKEQSTVERRVTALELGSGNSSSIAGTYLPNIHLKAVRELTFTDGSDRLAIQYLWYDKDYRFYISDSLRGMRHYIFTFNPAQFHGLTDPRWFSMNFDPEGNIICVFRTEGSGSGERLNPIVLVKSNAYAPVEVTFPADQAPAGWLQNCGFLCTEDSVFLVEYIRGGVQYAHAWKATMPVTDAANWEKVQTFSIGHDVEGMKRIKHMHNVDRDPFTGHIYTSTGDDSSEAAIFVSKDGGNTFSTVLESSQKYCRLLNFVWTKDFVYWATDAGGSAHFVFKVPRGEDGVIDVNNITDLHMFPNASAPTYASIYMPKIRAIVFLGRYDGGRDTDLPIDVLDLTDDSFHTIATVPGSRTYGFRCETFEYIPRGNDIPCGFSATVGPGGYGNFISVLGSRGGVNSRPNNLILTIDRVGSEFTMSISTVV